MPELLMVDTDVSSVMATGLTKTFGVGPNAVRVLRGVELAVRRAEFTVITGGPGAGKSTLVQCLAGLERPSAGEISIAGVEIGALPEDELTELRRDRVGLMFQRFTLLPEATVEDNIFLPFDLTGETPDQQWIHSLIEGTGIVDVLSERPVGLSDGQRQRVALVRAMATRPEVIFADDPAGHLGPVQARQLLRLLRMVTRSFGQSVVLVSRDPAAAEYADRPFVLADGVIRGASRHFPRRRA